AWEFGDPVLETATGSAATLAVPLPGVYTIRLTVTDNEGATATATTEVEVSEPPSNQSPVAQIVAVVDGLTVSVDGSGSTDPDGTVDGYAWEFGDPVLETATGSAASFAFP